MRLNYLNICPQLNHIKLNLRMVILYIYFPCIREIWTFVHPRIVIFPKSNIRGKYNYFEGEHIFISPLCKGNAFFIPPGQRFGEFYQMESFGNLCLQNYYFGTSLELYLLTWNTVIWPKRYILNISNNGNTSCWEGTRCFDKCHVGLFRPIEFLYK